MCLFLFLLSLFFAWDCQEGEHDFRNFCKVDPVNVSNFVRKLFRVSLHRQKPDGTAGSLDEECENGEHAENREDDFGSAAANHRSAAAKEREVWFFEVQGQAFLWHQVRCTSLVSQYLVQFFMTIIVILPGVVFHFHVHSLLYCLLLLLQIIICIGAVHDGSTLFSGPKAGASLHRTRPLGLPP